MSQKSLPPPWRVLKFIYQKLKEIQAIVYVHIPRLNLRQTAKFRSIIPNFDKVMPYYARSTRDFLHFTSHLP